MAVKLLYYFVFVFLGMMAFLLLQKPYNIEVNPNSKKEAIVEMNGAINYSISPNGIDSIASAKHVFRFATHDEFYDVAVQRLSQKGLKENLKANNGILEKENLTLEGDVKYKNSDGVSFRAPIAQYNLKSKVFTSDADFVLEDNRSITNGNSLVYQTKEGKIYANNIKSIAKVDDK